MYNEYTGKRSKKTKWLIFFLMVVLNINIIVLGAYPDVILLQANDQFYALKNYLQIDLLSIVDFIVMLLYSFKKELLNANIALLINYSAYFIVALSGNHRINK